jgi:hypothetical protein
MAEVLTLLSVKIFRDLTTVALHKRNIHSPSKLERWLGVSIMDDPNRTGTQHVHTTKRDPKCRFM